MRGPEYGGFTPPEAPQRPLPEKEEASKDVPESAENREAIEKFIDASLEELCERYLSKFNEGNNGIVLKLNMRDIPPKLVADLKEAGIELGDDKVAKILKVYSGGKGKQEFDMQSMAHDLVEAQPDKEKYAKVPKPYFYRDFAVGDKARDRLKGMNDKVQGGDRVEMFMMDYVPGDDVATILYKEIAKRHNKTVDMAQHVDEFTFPDLQDRVFQALEVRVPGGKSRDATARDFEMRKVFNENAAKIDAFLEKSDFQLHPAIVEQMENTMKLFHKNGLAFRDGHQRNFMIVGEPGVTPGSAPQERPQVFVIDYGAATLLAGRPLADVFKEVEGDEGKDAVVKNYPDDFAVANQLRKFTKPRAERMNAEEAKFLAELVSRRKAMERNPRLRSRVDAMLEKAESGGLNLRSDYANIVGTGIPSESNVDNFLSAALTLIEARPESRDDVRRFAEDMLRQQNVPWLRNKFSRFLKATA